MSDKLKPCPFCGGIALLFKSGLIPRPYIQCQQCGGALHNPVAELAIEQWNTRDHTHILDKLKGLEEEWKRLSTELAYLINEEAVLQGCAADLAALRKEISDE